MAYSHQQQAEPQAYNLNFHHAMQADQSGHRANLLASLRTGGPNMASQPDSMGLYNHTDGAQLKGGSSSFIPNGGLPPSRQNVGLSQHYGAQNHQGNRADPNGAPASLEDQIMMMRLQAALAGQAGLSDQARHQLAARQQIEMLRMQALQQQQQQQQQQQLAAHQRFLLAQIHAEYERQAQVAASLSGNHHGMQQQQQQQPFAHQGFSANGAPQVASAQEQRQAAQASIQASLRQRQAQQMYPQGFEQDQFVDEHAFAQSQQHAHLLALRQQQQQLQHQQHSRMQSGESYSRLPLEQRSWRGGAMASERNPSPPLMRTASPQVVQLPGQLSNRERTTSNTADSVSSWRSRAVTPSIVIDDSASEGSRSAAVSFDGDGGEGDQTPETSEEDLEVTTDLRKMLLGNVQAGSDEELMGKYGSISKGIPSGALATPTMNHTPTVHAPKAMPRAISLAAAPRTRAFTSEAKAAAESQYSAASRNLTLPPIQPRRQPKGQPNDFKEVNFQARMNSRTRKDAMSKLCASPRAASFGGNGLGFGSRSVSATMS